MEEVERRESRVERRESRIQDWCSLSTWARDLSHTLSTLARFCFDS
jgi:hypothetical protein